MNRHFTINFYFIAFPATIFIALLLNLLILSGIIASKFMGLGLLLVSLCSLSYLLRLTVKTNFFQLPIPEVEANLLTNKSAYYKKIVSLLFGMLILLWTVTLFLIMM